MMLSLATTDEERRAVQSFEIASAVSHVQCSEPLEPIYDSVITDMSVDFAKEYRSEILQRFSDVLESHR